MITECSQYKKAEAELQQQLGTKSDEIAAKSELLSAKTKELASLHELNTGLQSQLDAATAQLAQNDRSTKRPYNKRRTGPLHETVNVVIVLEQTLDGDISDSDIKSQIRRKRLMLRDNIGEQIDTAYGEHNLCATSETEGTILRYTDDDRGSDRVTSFMEIGSYKIIVGS
jgi:hypothetical protein